MKKLFLLIVFISTSLTAQTASEAYQKANELFKAGKHYDAIAAYSQAIELDPKNAHAYNERGICLAEFSLNEAAIKDYTKTIELMPNNEILLHNRAMAFIRLKKWNDALKDLDAALKVKPDYLEALLEKSKCYRGLGNESKTQEIFNEAIRINPDFAKIYLYRGNDYSRNSQEKEALQDYDKCIKLDGTLAEAFNARGNIYFNMHDYDSAYDDYEKALKLDSTKFYHFKNFGNVLVLSDKYKKGEDAYSKGIELNPQDTAAYYFRARAKYLQGNEKGAIQDCNKTLELNRKDEGALDLLMIIYAEKEDFNTATNFLNQIRNLSPENKKNLSGISKIDEDNNLIDIMKRRLLPEMFDNYSWYDLANIGISVSRSSGKSSIKSQDFPDMHYYAFQGPKSVDRSSALTALTTNSYSLFLSMFFPSESLGISLGYESRKQQNQDSQNPGTGITTWKGSAGIEDSYYWFKMWYEALGIDLGIGKLGANLMLQMGYSSEVKMFIRSERWDGLNLSGYTDQTYLFKNCLAYIFGAELQYYLPFLPVSIGIGYNLGIKGPIKTDNYELTTKTASGTTIEKGSDSIYEYGVGAFSGTYFFINVGLALK